MVKATPHGGANSLRTLKMSHSSAVEDGEIVVNNGQVLIACSKLGISREGAYVFRGPVEFPKRSEIFAVGDTLYWDNTNEKVTATPEGNTRVGLCIAAAAPEEGVVLVDLEPVVEVSGGGSGGGGGGRTLLAELGLADLDFYFRKNDDPPVYNYGAYQGHLVIPQHETPIGYEIEMLFHPKGTLGEGSDGVIVRPYGYWMFNEDANNTPYYDNDGTWINVKGQSESLAFHMDAKDSSEISWWPQNISSGRQPTSYHDIRFANVLNDQQPEYINTVLLNKIAIFSKVRVIKGCLQSDTVAIGTAKTRQFVEDEFLEQPYVTYTAQQFMATAEDKLTQFLLMWYADMNAFATPEEFKNPNNWHAFSVRIYAVN